MGNHSIKGKTLQEETCVSVVDRDQVLRGNTKLENLRRRGKRERETTGKYVKPVFQPPSHTHTQQPCPKLSLCELQHLNLNAI